MWLKMWQKLIILLPVLLLSACAGVTPDGNSQQPSAAILQAPAGDPQFSDVRDNVNVYRGQMVRWGGLITGIRNIGNSTELEVRAYPLNIHGQPSSASAQGVFLVRSPVLLNNHQYRRGRAVTVAGVVQGSQLTDSQGFYYLAPVIEARDYYVWQQPDYDDREYAYDPYDPHGRYFYPRFHFGIGVSKGRGWHVGPFGGISIGF